MKTIVAVDSFKGSLSSLEAGRTVAEAIESVSRGADAVKVFPLADGGEGTLDALVEGLGGNILPKEVTGPTGEKIKSRYAVLPDGTAVIETADAAGLTLVAKEKRNPLFTTTFGLGELIADAANRGARKFMIGIGGSATNDCGLGMMTALGAKFFAADGSPAGIMGKDLAGVAEMDLGGLLPVLGECEFFVACDVTNPLCGENGCSFVYAPQKGAAPDEVRKMDAWIKNFALLAEKKMQKKGAQQNEGAGAAGGLGFALSVFLNARLKKGIELLLDATGIKDALSDADVLITGEGRMDAQTAMGKAPVGVARLAKAINPRITVVALCGAAGEGAGRVNANGIDAYFSILRAPCELDEAMKKETAKKNLSAVAEQIFRLVTVCKNI